MKTVIIDDGWQTDDESRKYGFCGEWRVAKKKFYDFEKFVRDVHALGMKVMVWYSVPFVGFFSESFVRFKNKLLYRENGLNAGVLDPRYKEVRDYLVSVYKTALSKAPDNTDLHLKLAGVYEQLNDFSASSS